MHYSMIVAAENYVSLTSRLAPFQANDTGQCPRQHLVFYDAQREARSAWEATEVTRVQMGDELVPLWDNRLAGWAYTPDGWAINCDGSGQRWPMKNVHIKKIYPSYEQWLVGEGFALDPETNQYGYWYNPNGKWLSWEVGGRWSGLLDGYNPASNPLNFTPCDTCAGTGDRPGWVHYVAVAPGPDGSLNTFRGPNREQVVLAAAEYVHASVNPVQAFHQVTRRRPRKLVFEQFDPEAVLCNAGVTVDRCFVDAHATYHNGCDICGGAGKIRSPFNAPYAGDSMIAGAVDWEGIKDRQAAKAAHRWDVWNGMEANPAAHGQRARMPADSIFNFMDIAEWIDQHGDDRAGYIAHQREEAAAYAFLDHANQWMLRSECAGPEFHHAFWAFVHAIPPTWVVYVLDIYTQ